MSNVLIGIIGVILFIGLALAGALFLGPRFQQSTNESKAAAAIQAVSQVSHAAALYRLGEGSEFNGVGAAQLMEGGYLKAIPTFEGGATVTYGYGGSKSMSTRLTKNAKAVCESVNRQTRGTADIPVEIVSSVGCYVAEGTKYFVYATV